MAVTDKKRRELTRQTRQTRAFPSELPLLEPITVPVAIWDTRKGSAPACPEDKGDTRAKTASSCEASSQESLVPASNLSTIREGSFVSISLASKTFHVL